MCATAHSANKGYSNSPSSKVNVTAGESTHVCYKQVDECDCEWVVGVSVSEDMSCKFWVSRRHFLEKIGLVYYTTQTHAERERDTE